MTLFQLHRLFNSERGCPECLTGRASHLFSKVLIVELFKGFWLSFIYDSHKWPLKNNAQIVHMNARLTVIGVLKGFIENKD